MVMVNSSRKHNDIECYMMLMTTTRIAYNIVSWLEYVRLAVEGNSLYDKNVQTLQSIISAESRWITRHKAISDLGPSVPLDE